MYTRGAAPLAVADSQLTLAPVGRIELLFIACMALALLGYHYLVDLPAGVLVAAGALWVVRAPGRQRGANLISPG